ncbi:hypothetical protein Tco_0959899 [Tanacetum coccineum]
MNYKPVVAGNQSNGNARTKACDDAGKMETLPGKDYIFLPLWPADPLFSQSSKSSPNAEFKLSGDDEKNVTEEPGKEGGDLSKEDENNDQEKNDNVNNTNNVNAASTNEVNAVGRKSSIKLPDDPNMPELEDIVNSDDDEDNGIRVNAGDSKLMLLGINLLLLGKVNAARHNLLLLVVKMVNWEQQLQTLVDGKKIVVTKAFVRRDLQLDDEEGTDCLSNATIFKELTRMGAKTTAWNEFSSTMSSAIICLATNQKFNFSKYIFESMVNNLDNAGKFLMYPRKQKSKRSKRKDTEERKIHDIDVDENITLENVHDAKMFNVNDLHGDEVFIEREVPVKEVSDVGKVNTASIATTVSAATITKDEITLAQALAKLKSVKPKGSIATTTTTKGILLQEPSESITTTTTTIPSKDKGKAEFDEEASLAREKDEANVALTEEWNDIQEKIKADYKSFANIQELFDKASKRVNTFIDFRTELVKGTKMEESSKKAEVMEKSFKKAEIAEESSSKRAGNELEQENAKKQKVDDD